MSNNELKHYGVPGMRWGHRKNPDDIKRQRRDAKADDDGGEEHEDYKKTIARKSLSSMSTKEIQEINTRIQAENQFKELNKTAFDRFKDKAKSVLVEVATNQAKSFINHYADAGRGLLQDTIDTKTPIGELLGLKDAAETRIMTRQMTQNKIRETFEALKNSKKEEPKKEEPKKEESKQTKEQKKQQKQAEKELEKAQKEAEKAKKEAEKLKEKAKAEKDKQKAEQEKRKAEEKVKKAEEKAEQAKAEAEKNKKEAERLKKENERAEKDRAKEDAERNAPISSKNRNNILNVLKTRGNDNDFEKRSNSFVVDPSDQNKVTVKDIRDSNSPRSFVINPRSSNGNVSNGTRVSGDYSSSKMTATQRMIELAKKKKKK